MLSEHKSIHLAAWEDEILIHAITAAGAFERFQKLALAPETRQRRVVWAELHAFLTHSAMVSKLLFPPRRQNSDLASATRSRFKVDDSSPLNSRKSRDNLEHIDERLASWAKDGRQGLLEAVFESREEYNYFDKTRWRMRRVLILDEWIFITTARDDQAHEMELDNMRGAIADLFKVP